MRMLKPKKYAAIHVYPIENETKMFFVQELHNVDSKCNNKKPVIVYILFIGLFFSNFTACSLRSSVRHATFVSYGCV